MKNVAINILFYHSGLAGVRTYTNVFFKELKNHLELCKKNKFLIYISKKGFKDFQNVIENNNIENVDIIQFSFNPSNKIQKLFIEQIFLPIHIIINRIKVLHSLDYAGPLFAPCKKIITIHDLNYLYYPQMFTFNQLLFRKFFVPLTIRRANLIISISHYTATQIKEHFDCADKITTVYLDYVDSPKKIDDNEFSILELANLEFKEDTKFILAVGTLKKHKNYENLILAFDKVVKLNYPLKLYIVGRGDNINELKALVKKLGLNDYIYITGFVSKRTLDLLYTKCLFFVSASLYEGFGIPLVEAMNYNKPILCSNISVFQEIIGNAALFFDPKDVASIYQKTIQLYESEELRLKLISNSKKQKVKLQQISNFKNFLNLYNN